MADTRPGDTTVITMSVSHDDLDKLDALAGPRGRSRWLRQKIAVEWAEHERERERRLRLFQRNQPGRKATSRRKA